MAVRGSEVELDRGETPPARPSGDLLGRVAVALASTLDLDATLHLVAELVREISSGQRCSVVLLEGRRLVPAVAIGSRPDDDLWTAFRAMPPIDLGDEQWGLLEAGKALVVDDARATAVIPSLWVERFALRTVVVVPLMAHGEPCGVMAVDWPEVRAIAPDELADLEAVGVYAGLAVHNARLHAKVAAKTETLEHLFQVAAALNSSSSLVAVFDLICDAFERLLGATHCSVNLADPEDPLRLQTLVSRGDPWIAESTGSPLPPEALARMDDVRRTGAGPVVYATLGGEGTAQRPNSSLRSAVLFPLFGTDGLIGSVVAGFPRPGGPPEHDLEAGQTLAELAATAISRADLHDHLGRRVRQLEILFRLSELVTGTAPLASVLAGVNQVLEGHLGIRLESVAVADPDAQAAIGGPAPTPDEEAAMVVWRSELDLGAHQLGLRRSGPRLLVPIVHRRLVLGALAVAADDGSVSLVDEEFLLTIGGACADVVHRAVLVRSLAEGERRVAVAAERDRIVRGLHGTAGNLVTGIGMKIAGWLDEAPDETWRHRLTTLLRLAREGEREIREAVYSLAFVDARSEGLPDTLRTLGDRFAATTGIAVEVEVAGEPARLAPEQEDTVFRVLHQALSDVERHAEASSVRAVLRYSEAGLRLTIEDNGVGVRRRPHDAVGHDPGFQATERRIRSAGGTLAISRSEPGGTRLVVSVPYGAPEDGPPGEVTRA